MKVFIILTTYLAVTLASENHQKYPVAHQDTRYDGHLGYAELKIGPDGVPIDTLEVQHAREAHLALVAKAVQEHAAWAAQHQSESSHGGWAGNNRARSSHALWADNNQAKSSHAAWNGINQGKSTEAPWARNDGSKGGQNEWSNSNSHNRERKYDGRFGYAQPKIGPNGVPIDTLEVEQAKVVHLSVLSKAKESHAGWSGNNGAYGGRYGSSNLNYLNPQNNLKVANLNTYSKASNDHQRHRRGIQERHSNREQPEEEIHFSYAEIGPNGLPLDTPEVLALKQAHLAAHSAALDLIEKHRKSPIWTNDQYDNGAWKDDTNAWADVETSTGTIWNNNVGRRNKGYSNNNGWDNQRYDTTEWKNVQPATSTMNMNMKSGPHTKITVKSKGWNNVSNNIGWNNEVFNNNNNDWNNDANTNNGWNNGANNNKVWNNESYNNNAWKNADPPTSQNNQRQDSGLHTKVTWQNNPWSDADNNAWKTIESTTGHNIQISTSRSYELTNNGWNNSGTTRKYSPYKGPFHVPKIHNGVPEYTPEVQLAREQHLAALAMALAKAPTKSPRQEYHH